MTETSRDSSYGPGDEPSPRLIDQRVRNRLIEALELAASFEKQRKYQRAAPGGVHVPHEVINQWDDWYCSSNRIQYRSPVFTEEERKALAAYAKVVERVCEQTPQMLPPLDELLQAKPWQDLREAARAALAVFARRGRFSDEHEETLD